MTSVYILRTDDTDLTFWKISSGHISATGHPIHFIFGSGVGFSRSIEWRYFRLEQIQDAAGVTKYFDPRNKVTLCVMCIAAPVTDPSEDPAYLGWAG